MGKYCKLIICCLLFLTSCSEPTKYHIVYEKKKLLRHKLLKGEVYPATIYRIGVISGTDSNNIKLHKIYRLEKSFFDKSYSFGDTIKIE